jgi:hypothetical protein
MKTTTLLQESNMQADEQFNSRPNSVPLDWSWVPTPAPPKPNRAAYEAARRAELDDVRRLDQNYRQLLNYLRPLGIRGDDDLWGRDHLSPEDREEHDKAARELYLSHRFLVCAVEVYLLGCVEYSGLTGEGAVRRATNTDSLIACLQAEEDLMIKTHGPPWLERTRS